MIELINLRKTYGDLSVLRGVSLEIPEGKIVSVAGPSGAGKSTLLQIAGSLLRPDSGSVLYDGEDIFRLSDRNLSEFRNRNIGFVFQFHRLLPEFTALENTMLPALIGGTRRKDASAAAMRLLEMLGVEARAGHRPGEMSGGERQRVALARALINNPKVVLADEPTGSLDSANREEIQQLFLSLRDTLGQTFVIVTHDTSLAETADIRVDMRDGDISLSSPTPEI